MSKQIVLAEEMGYCWGVRRALDIIRTAGSPEDPVATVGDVIHNPQVVESLRAHGVDTAESVAAAAARGFGRVAITAHGAGPERAAEAQARGLELIDTTCPLVTKVQRLAALEPAELAAHQFSRQKAAYIVGLSRAVHKGELDLDEIGTLPHDEAINALTRHKGVGRWTAEYLLMRGYGAPDSIPAADLGLRDAIGKAYLGRRASEDEVRGIAESWAGQRSWAAFLWWLSLHVPA